MTTARQPLRVLMTTDATGGVWTYSLDLARGLRGRGIDVVLAAMGPAPTGAQRNAADALGVRVEHVSLRLEWMKDPWRDLEAASEWLQGLERQQRSDVVHLNGYALARSPFVSPKVVVAHSCVLSWWEAVLGEPATAHATRYRQAAREGLAAAAHVVSPTLWMRRAVERHYGPAARASVIHNASRPGAFAPREKQAFILGAGRVWDEAKNLRTLARAGRSLPWPVKIAGPLEPPRPDGDARAGDRPDGFEDAELLGQLSAADMADLYARAPIFVAPARYEPFGLTILEAALSGCALVLGDIPSLRELWEDAAVFIAPGDVAALSACLHDLVRHPELRHELGAEARARAARYRYEDMVDAYIRVYASAGVDAPSPTPVGAPPEERGCTS